MEPREKVPVTEVGKHGGAQGSRWLSWLYEASPGCWYWYPRPDMGQWWKLNTDRYQTGSQVIMPKKSCGSDG